MQSLSNRYGFLIPILLVAVAATTLLFRAEPRTCTPQDPIRVSLGETSYSIPAVLLPNLRTEQDVVLVKRSEALSGGREFSRRGSQLRWWFCASEDAAPLAVNSFSINGRWMADAVAQGELAYRWLPDVSILSFRVGQVPARLAASEAAPVFFSDRFRVNCGPPSNLPPTGDEQVTGTQCFVDTVNVSADTTLRITFWIKESPGRPTRNSRADWPELFREVEHFVSAIQVPAG